MRCLPCPLHVLVLMLAVLANSGAAGAAVPAYRVSADHPRIFVTKAGLPDLAQRCAGPLAADYRAVKAAADAAVARGSIPELANRWAIPADLMNCGLAYLVERQAGRPCGQYPELIRKVWGDGGIIANPDGSAFGYHALAYDWIYDALTADERRRYGQALGTWLRFYTGEPEILLKYGYWEYNQTWGPIHLNVMNARDAITPKLFVALAIAGAGTPFEVDAKQFLDSWARRVPAECLPAFERIGGVWPESFGHGSYGPVTVVGYAFEAWRTATGQDLFAQMSRSSYLREESRWVAYTLMPHVARTAWIDDNDGESPQALCRVAPMLGRVLRDPLANWFSEEGARRGWLSERWQRVACYDPTVAPKSPRAMRLPLAYLFKGAGHVYMRSGWDDPNATWTFFGAGPFYASHARDDEGQFLIGKQGALVSRQGGQGHNDDDYYAGGSLIYNIVTIYDKEEKFRRAERNENDGGLIRHVYEAGGQAVERGHIVAYENTPAYTYAAADLTRGYNPHKAREVTRQFLYLRGRREFFVVFDRVEATSAAYPKHWFLHLPTRPEVSGTETVRVPEHVSEFAAVPLTATWVSLPEADGDPHVASTGRSRVFLRTLLPHGAVVTRRGGPGYDAWGHPSEPTAQYNHESPGRHRPPICPWRLEVAAPHGEARALFLNVFEVTREEQRVPTPVRLISQTASEVSVQFGDGAGARRVSFRAAGPLGGAVSTSGGGSRKLAEGNRVADQYGRAAVDSEKGNRP
jgi:hypothetical protein